MSSARGGREGSAESDFLSFRRGGRGASAGSASSGSPYRHTGFLAGDRYNSRSPQVPLHKMRLSPRAAKIEIETLPRGLKTDFLSRDVDRDRAEKEAMRRSEELRSGPDLLYRSPARDHSAASRIPAFDKSPHDTAESNAQLTLSHYKQLEHSQRLEESLRLVETKHKHERNSWEDQRQNDQNSISKERARSDALATEIESLRAKVRAQANASAELEDFKVRFSYTMDQMQKLEEEKDEIALALRTERLKINESRQDMENNVTSVEAALTEKNHELIKKEKMLLKAASQCENFEKEMEARDDKIEQLQQALQERADLIDQANDHRDKLWGELEQAHEEKQKHARTAQSVEEELNAHKRHTMEFQNHTERMTDGIKEASERERSALQRRIDALEAKNQHLLSEVGQLREAAARSAETETSAMTQFRIAEQQFEKAVRSNMTMRQENEELQCLIQRLQAGQKAPYKVQPKTKITVDKRPASSHERPAWKPACNSVISQHPNTSAKINSGSASASRTKSRVRSGGYSNIRGTTSGTRATMLNAPRI